VLWWWWGGGQPHLGSKPLWHPFLPSGGLNLTANIINFTVYFPVDV
jgi:hypothetical protein